MYSRKGIADLIAAFVKVFPLNIDTIISLKIITKIGVLFPGSLIWDETPFLNS
jgi:hypothetical protein